MKPLKQFCVSLSVKVNTTMRFAVFLVLADDAGTAVEKVMVEQVNPADVDVLGVREVEVREKPYCAAVITW